MKIDFSLNIKEDGGLYFKDSKGECEVFVDECFPWSAPGEFLSIRNVDGREVHFLESCEVLSDEQAALIKEYLAKKTFVLKIVKIFKIFDDIELRRYDVLTSAGKRSLYTKLEDWPMVENKEVVLIRDIYGDLYQIDDWKQLDRKSQSEISVFIS